MSLVPGSWWAIRLMMSESLRRVDETIGEAAGKVVEIVEIKVIV